MKQRIDSLDLWRSLCVFIMVVFHALYDLELFGVVTAGTMSSPAAKTLCYLTGGSFVLISGAVVRFSRDPIRRGFLVFCAGLLVTVATTLLRMPVAFGILQLLGICMIVYGLLRGGIERWCGLPFAAVCILLFAGTWMLTANVVVDIKWIYPFGLRTSDFYSADYYPLLPWLFLFLAGTYLGKELAKVPEHRHYPAALTFPGRHSLVIYLLHQPVLYGLCLLLIG